MSKLRLRALIAASTLMAGLVWSVPTTAKTEGPPPLQACDDPSESMTLFAEPVGKNRIGYGLEPGEATVPGPTVEMNEGDCLAITLVNDTTKRLSLHAHGVDYTTASDGTPLNASCVAPGRSRTYVWQAHAPGARSDGTYESGSAGYWHYHDHCRGTPHGTGGIRKGLFGALIVRRAGDPVPDTDPCVLVMLGTTFNLKRAPRTPNCEARLGQRVEFVVIGHGELLHTFHLHGHRWANTRTGYLSGSGDPAQVIDNRTVGPADSFGFQVIAGEHVGPGAWMYHCHVQSHSDAGMAGIFTVTNQDGSLPRAAREALRSYRHEHAGGHHHG